MGFASTQGAPIGQVVHQLLSQAVDYRASHVHVESEDSRVRVRYRMEGALQDLMSYPKHFQAPLTNHIKSLAGLDGNQWKQPQYGVIRLVQGGRSIDVTVSTCPTARGEKIV